MGNLYESMTRVQFGDGVVRVWRGYQDGFPGDNRDIKAVLDSYNPLRPVDSFAGDIIVKLLALDRVNAVEVIGRDGNGTVVYKDWP